MNIIAIDPGTTESGWCIMDAETLKPLCFGKTPNGELLRNIIRRDFEADYAYAAVEMIASYGMAVGKEVFITCLWIGRFIQALIDAGIENEPRLLYRRQEKLHICGDPRAKDANIRLALIDRFAKHDLKNGKGTKNNPDWFYGFKADIWQAAAVGVTFIETMMGKGDTWE